MLISDAQVHLWEADRPDRPWPKEIYVEPHREPLLGAEMIAAMDAAGVDRAVVVPPSWIGENNATALEQAALYPDRFAVMGRFDPHAPNAREALQNWRDQPHMLGIRMTFHREVWARWLDDGSLDWFWAEAERQNLPLMILVPGLTPTVAPIAEKHPGLPLVLDHMARNSALKDDACFADLDDMLALARFPNVSVKTTAVPCYSSEPYPYRNLHPYLRRIYDAFGPRRMLWGSDITRLPCSYRECRVVFEKELDFLTAEDKEWVLGKTAAEVLRWPESGR